MVKKGEYQIPFDRCGNMMSYPLEQVAYVDAENGTEYLSGVHFNVPQEDGSFLYYLTPEIEKRFNEGKWRHKPYSPEWRDNCVFADTLQYARYGRGRSAANIILKSTTTGHEYSMFLTDFDDLMQSVGFDGDKVTAAWTFVKRGQNYGIKLGAWADLKGRLADEEV